MLLLDCRHVWTVVRFAFLLILAMTIGAYLAILLWHTLFNDPDSWTLSNFHLSLQASLRAWITPVTFVDANFRRALRMDKPSPRSLPVHFVLHVGDRPKKRNSLSPQVLLSAAQRCSIESALRVCEHATVWMVGEESDHISSDDLTAWASWRRAISRRRLGTLTVRSHRFHASSSIGHWLLARGASLRVNTSDWKRRGWPSYPALVSDLVRLDVLEAAALDAAAGDPAGGPRGGGAIYLDLDVIVLHSDLLLLPEGFALQVPTSQLGLPFRLGSLADVVLFRGGGLTLRRLHEACNGAVLISRSAHASVPKAIARSALESWVAWNFSGEWGIIGPRATTQAWVKYSDQLGADFRLYSPETFGFVTCGRHGGGVSLISSSRQEAEECVAFSTSSLPLDDDQVSIPFPPC